VVFISHYPQLVLSLPGERQLDIQRFSNYKRFRQKSEDLECSDPGDWSADRGPLGGAGDSSVHWSPPIWLYSPVLFQTLQQSFL